jgi:probable rRNA maturation factor
MLRLPGFRGRTLKPATRSAGARPRSTRPPLPPTIDILVESPLWKTRRGIRAVLQRAIGEAAAMAATRGGELAIVLTDDSGIRALNRDWRGKDQPTNVLSFPAQAPTASLPAKGGRVAAGMRPRERADRVRLLGDIVLAYETMAREALAERRPFAHHLAHLAVHGFLHLVGHDHAAEAEADAMEALEVAVLARLNVPNPYATAAPTLPRLRAREGRGA